MYAVAVFLPVLSISQYCVKMDKKNTGGNRKRLKVAMTYVWIDSSLVYLALYPLKPRKTSCKSRARFCSAFGWLGR